MSNSLRAWLLLGVTLCLGIAIGLLGAGALQERRVARVNDIRRPGGFIEHVHAVIRPTSDSQWQAIRPLVEATAQQNVGMRRMHDSAMRVTLDSLRARLDPMLNAEQRERLARFVPGRVDGPPGRRGRGRDARPGLRDGRPPRAENAPPSRTQTQ